MTNLGCEDCHDIHGGCQSLALFLISLQRGITLALVTPSPNTPQAFQQFYQPNSYQTIARFCVALLAFVFRSPEQQCNAINFIN